MKPLIILSMVLLGLLGFSRCNSQRLLLDMPPFEVGEVKYSSGVSGIESEDTGDYLFVQVVLKEGICLTVFILEGKSLKWSISQIKINGVYIGLNFIKPHFMKKRSLCMLTLQKRLEIPC